ncbi:MAG: alpha/beta hydrolase [Terriglobia bacterium]|jgi:hypothetical protein
MAPGSASKFILSRLLLVGLALVLVMGLLRAFENRFIFFPPRYPEGFSSPESHGLHLEEVWVVAQDGVRLNAWFLSQPASRKALLWLHGNAENIGMGLDHMNAFSKLGVNVLALDYRGYGKSNGSPDEAGVYADGDAGYRYLVDSRRFGPRDIFIYGHSLGGAVAIDVASRHECGGLIVESSFTTAGDMARLMFYLPFTEYLPRSRFDSRAKIARVHAPILLIHGTRDRVIPFSMGEQLFQAAPEPKSFLAIQGADHDDPYVVGGEVYWRRLSQFVDGGIKNKE